MGIEKIDTSEGEIGVSHSSDPYLGASGLKGCARSPSFEESPRSSQSQGTWEDYADDQGGPNTICGR